MEKPTGSNLLSLYGELEIQITKWVGKRKTKLFCRKHEELVTCSFAQKHNCLQPRRIYTKEGEERPTVIYCPHLTTLKGTPFYKEHESIIYESLEGIYEITPQFKRRPQPLEKAKKEDLFTKQSRNLKKIVDAGKVLTSGSA